MKSRRNFIKTTSAATLATAFFPNIVNAQSLGSKTIKVGLIGCGGRGGGALQNALNADPDIILWSVADVFAEKIPHLLHRFTHFGNRIQVPKERQFSGLNAYQQLIDSGVDVVLLCTPPAFRPQHLRAAVEAGKHSFIEKPMAVDMAGVHSVLESAKLAKQKNVSIEHGFCWRFAPTTRALYHKILNGDFGSVRSIYGTYFSHIPKPIPKDAVKPKGMGDVEWQIRWWTNFEWLSGAPILEQFIHTIDKIAWAMGDTPPIAAVGTGGRIARNDPSNIYDHYNVTFEYPNQIFCHLGARQFNNCFTDITDRITCEDATIIGPDSPRAVDQQGKTSWRYKGNEGEERNMYQVCHNEFFSKLRKGIIVNAGEYSANATALAILGREAAHTGKRIKWKKLMKSNNDIAPDTLKLSDTFPIAPVPVPGKIG